MEEKYARELMILPSQCDAKGMLGIPNCFELFMDIATEHAERLGIGMALTKTRGLFWLTIKTKFRFIRRPAITERVLASTWPDQPRGMRCVRHYALTQGDALLVAGKTEWSLMNLRTGRLEDPSGVFPEGISGAVPPVCEAPFARIDDSFDDAPYAEHLVRATDIDFAGHMNNAAYVRALADSFSSKEWDRLGVSGAEVVFRAPCFEGDTLRFQKRSDAGAMDIRASLPDGRTVLLARLDTREE